MPILKPTPKKLPRTRVPVLTETEKEFCKIDSIIQILKRDQKRRLEWIRIERKEIERWYEPEDLLALPISILKLPPKALKAVEGLGARNLSELADSPAGNLESWAEMVGGQKGVILTQIRVALALYGLSIKMNHKKKTHARNITVRVYTT